MRPRRRWSSPAEDLPGSLEPFARPRPERRPTRSRRRVVVHGRVQGVGFRAACAREAARRGLGGWVRNRPEGTVEAVFEGDARAVDAMTAWCQDGPLMARVRHMERFDEPPAGEDVFSVR